MVMNRRTERLSQRIAKTGVRASLKAGHPLSESELRKLRVQTVPATVRILFCALGLTSAGAAYWLFSHDFSGLGLLAITISVFALLFGIFGIRRTLEKILDSVDAVDAARILGNTFEAISSAMGSLLDGL